MIVMKFGGTSVGTADAFAQVAEIVKSHVEQQAATGKPGVVVVTSAMSGVTNQLVAWVNQVAPLYDAREYDAVVATGEQVTSGLTALALQQLGVNARSWQGWQLPLVSDDAHGKARIMDVRTDEMLRLFAEQKQVAVVAGFQGVAPGNRISTLGRRRRGRWRGRRWGGRRRRWGWRGRWRGRGR